MSGADSEEQRQTLEKRARERRKANWQTVLSTQAGREAIELLVFEFGGLQAQSHAADSHQRSFNDGQRAVGITLDLELKEASRSGWALMHAERIERLKNEPVDPSPNKSDQ